MHLFISHATKDSGREALALAEALEAQGHVCWIAPRDVRPGIPYPRQIVEALEQCSGLVLLLSPAANDSADVLQEVQLAAAAKKTIAPVVLNGTSPGADLRYYVSVRHQIAWSGADATARRLVETFPSPPLGGEGQGEGVELRLSPPPMPAAPPEQTQLPLASGASPSNVSPPPSPRPSSSRGGRGRMLAFGAGALALVALIAVLAWQPWRTSGAPAPSPATTETADANDARLGAWGPDGATFRDCNFCPEMVVIPGGSFLMGSPVSEAGRESDEGPQRRVTITRFAAGKYEVTFDEWAACASRGGCRSNPHPSDSSRGRGRRPVINVSWNDAQEYLRWISRETGQHYRLLSESEWEYAARAGTTTPWSWGGDPNQACLYANLWDLRADFSSTANCDDGIAARPAPVGSFLANRFGLHDMHGNVWEWTQDCYASSKSVTPADGSSYEASNCVGRVIRGGAWNNGSQYLRSARRSREAPAYQANHIGLRVARTA